MEKRDIATPTIVSISISDEFLLVKDLSGKQHIFPISEKEKIGNRLLELAQNENLPHCDVSKLTVTNEETESDSSEFITDLFDTDNLKREGMKFGLNYLQNLMQSSAKSKARRPF